MQKMNLGNQVKELTAHEIKCLHIPEEQLLRLGMDGEDVSCEPAFGGDSES